jgi:hypothetical protein
MRGNIPTRRWAASPPSAGFRLRDLRGFGGTPRKNASPNTDVASRKGVTTPNVKNRTLRNLDHSFEAVKDRKGPE